MVYIAPGSPSPGNWRQAAPLGLGEEDPEENGGVRGGGVGGGLPLHGQTRLCAGSTPHGDSCAAPGRDRPLTLRNQGPCAPRSLGSGWLECPVLSGYRSLL